MESLFHFCVGILADIIDNPVFSQWLPMALCENEQKWMDCNTRDTLIGQVLLLLLITVNLILVPEGCKQIKIQYGPKEHIYSAITVFVHPQQTLVPISLLESHSAMIIRDGHSVWWSILCKTTSGQCIEVLSMHSAYPYLELSADADPLNLRLFSVLICEVSGWTICTLNNSTIFSIQNRLCHLLSGLLQ